MKGDENKQLYHVAPSGNMRTVASLIYIFPVLMAGKTVEIKKSLLLLFRSKNFVFISKS